MDEPVAGGVSGVEFLEKTSPDRSAPESNPGGANGDRDDPEGDPGSSSTSIDARRITVSTSPKPPPHFSREDLTNPADRPGFEPATFGSRRTTLPAVDTTAVDVDSFATHRPASATPSYRAGRCNRRVSAAPAASPRGLKTETSQSLPLSSSPLSSSSSSSPSSNAAIAPRNPPTRGLPDASFGSCIHASDPGGSGGRRDQSLRVSATTPR